MSQFILKTWEEIKEKVKLLNTLKDVSVTAKISKGDSESEKALVDQQYEKLNCEITPIDESSDKYKFLEKFIN